MSCIALVKVAVEMLVRRSLAADAHVVVLPPKGPAATGLGRPEIEFGASVDVAHQPPVKTTGVPSRSSLRGAQLKAAVLSVAPGPICPLEAFFVVERDCLEGG